jgi:hypothetical protein
MKIVHFIIASIFLLSSTSSFAQGESMFSEVLNKKVSLMRSDETLTVWIYFKDKPGDWQTNIKKAESIISEKSLARRQKMKKAGPLLSYIDIPVDENYIKQTIPYLEKFRQQSRWLNAISAEVKKSELTKITNLQFVSKIDVVRKGSNTYKFENSKVDNKKNLNSKYNYNYGSSLTQVEQINVPIVHDLGFSGAGITICVLDAGFNNLEHQAFSTMEIAAQWDFVNNDGNVDDEEDMGSGNHGTMTLSTIGGFYSGQLIGPAFGATYLLAKTENTDSETQVEEDNWVAGAEWADALGADITSTSLGYIDFDNGSGYSASELDGNTAIITIAADIAASLGILVVNSAGNEGDGVTTIGAPADGDSVLAVGAVYSDGSRVYFSSVGPTGDGRIKPDVMAMGSGVVVADTYGNYYTTASGTSFSCPLTAGAAALLWQMVPNASNMEIFEALKATANNSQNPNNQYGWGIINIYAAYEYLAFPRITHSPLSDTENTTGPYTVTAEISSNFDLIGGSPNVCFRKDNGTWSQIPMTSNKETGTFIAEIPGDGAQGTYDYYITAENSNALVSLPENAPSSFLTFNVGPDSEAPIINHNPIAEYYINLWSQAVIVAEISDNIQIDTELTFVEWKINGESQTPIPFNFQENNICEAVFPFFVLSIGDLIEYRIIAQDVSSAQNSSSFPESGFQSFNITDRISFEQNQYSHNWIFAGNADWYITSDQHQHGTYSVRSGIIDDDQSSGIEITFTCNENGNITFYNKVSSESNWDFLEFYLNNTKMDEWSGEVAWTLQNYSVSAGTHTIKWIYGKDGSLSNGSDCAWIDNITFPGIQQTYSVIFTVTDGSNPIEGANVNFRSQNILTDTDGKAVFYTIPPGNNIAYTVNKDGFETFTGTLTVTDQDVNQNVTLIQSVKVNNPDQSISLYPIPANDIIFIRGNNETKEVHILDVTGRTVQQMFDVNDIMNVSGLKAGIYQCIIISSIGTSIHMIIVN